MLISLLRLSECLHGTFGLNCNKTCDTNYFGKLCKETCNCTVDQYCDNAKGCRNISEILSSSMYILTVVSNSYKYWLMFSNVRSWIYICFFLSVWIILFYHDYWVNEIYQFVSLGRVSIACWPVTPAVSLNRVNGANRCQNQCIKTA